MNFSKKKGLGVVIIVAILISLIGSAIVYATTNNNYTVTINFDKTKYRASYQKTGEGDDIKIGTVLLSEFWVDEYGEHNGPSGEIKLRNAEIQEAQYIGNVSFDNDAGTITFNVTKQNEADTVPSAKVELNNNWIYLAHNGNEIEMGGNESEYIRIATTAVEQNTTYNVVTHRRIAINYYVGNPENEWYNEEQDESINQDKKIITYKWQTWDNEQNKNVIYPVNVSIVKGNVDGDIITVDSTEVLTNTNPENENSTNYELKLNSYSYERYYLKVESEVNDKIALNYWGDNQNKFWNLKETTIRDEQGNYYIDLSNITEDININYVGNRMDSHKVVFENYSAVNGNTLTYTYNNKNVYVEFVPIIWGEQGQELGAPLALTKQDDDDKYEYSFLSSNDYNDYCLKLSYDNGDNSLKGLVWFKINNSKAEKTRDYDNDIIVYNKLDLYYYNQAEITVNGLYSLVGDVAVNFADVSYKGTNIPATLDEYQNLNYLLDNNNEIYINFEEKWGDQEDDWRRIEPEDLNSLKVFSEDIQDRKYRLEISGGYLKVNGEEAQMDEIDAYYWDDEAQANVKGGTREVYFLKQEDIIDNKIILGIELGHTFTVNPGDSGRITIGEDLKSATWRVGDENNSEVTATFTKGKFREEGVWTEQGVQYYYQLDIKDTELADDVIELTNYDSEKMEVVIRDYEEGQYKLPVVQNNGKTYIQLTGLTNNEEPYYLPTGFHFDIEMKGASDFVQVDAPESKEGYFTISAEREENTEGCGISIWFQDENEKYIIAEDGTLEADETTKPIYKQINFNEIGKATDEVKYPTGAKYIELIVNMGQNTDAQAINLYENGQITDFELQDKIKHKTGILEIPTDKNIGMTISFVHQENEHDPVEDDPTYEFQAHVLSWSNFAQSGWPDDAQIVGGRAKIVEAYMPIYDGEGKVTDYEEIYNIKTAEKGYGKDAQKYTYGEKMPYEWVRGDMYPFAVLQDEDGGEVEAIAGVKVVYEFTPNYGKQLVRVGLGEDAEIGNNPKYYEFIMPANHSHFSAEFKTVENTSLIGNDSAVSNITYTLDNNALDSGTAVLSIDKVEDLTNDQKAGFAEKAGSNYEVSKYLDVDLTQVWFKGKEAEFNQNTGYSEQDVWKNEIYDLNDKKATITITLDEGISPEDVIILHELHNEKGEPTGYETVKIINKEKNDQGIWIITFETSKFSNYAIASKKEIHVHSWNNGVVTKKATCTETGIKTYTCAECGETKTETIAKIVHTPGTATSSSKVTSKATISKNGVITTTTTTKCTVCGGVIDTKTTTTSIYYPKTISLSKTSFTYNKKAQKPTVTVKDSKGKVIATSNYTVTYSNKSSKKVGRYSITIKFKGNYSGTKTLTYDIKPKGTSLSKLTKGSKQFKATWKAQKTETTGYEVQYSTDKNFKSGNKTVNIKKNKTTSTTVKKLKKKKKYYVRVRTYKTVKFNEKNVKIYSGWSKVLNVKTK